MTQHNNSQSEIAKQWLTHLQEKGKSQHTILAYRRGWQHFVRWYEQAYEADVVIDAVMPRDVRDWQSYQQTTKKAAPATVNQRLVAISTLFQWAHGQGLCRENPADAVTSIRLAPQHPKALPTKSLRRLLRAARSHPRDYAIIELLAGTGLRVSELLALQIGDVILNERSGKVIVRHGKYGTYREVPLTADVRGALRHYLESSHPDPSDAEAPFWRGTRGGLKARSSVMRLLEKYARLANIEPVPPHSLRHTFATRYLQANPDDLRGLARLLGHANLNTVMIYTEPDMDDLMERIERVEGQLA